LVRVWAAGSGAASGADWEGASQAAGSGPDAGDGGKPTRKMADSGRDGLISSFVRSILSLVLGCQDSDRS